MTHPENVQGVWAVIPVKALAYAKSRLLVSDEVRRAFAKQSFMHVMNVMCDVLPPCNIVVISRDDAVLALARVAGAQALREAEEGDLNDALGAAALFVQQHGARAVLSIFSDMPFVTTEDVKVMLAGFDGRNVVIAPDEKGSGSNALLMEPCAIPYRHGEDSFRRHLAAIGEADRTFMVALRPGLMRDVDTLEELEAHSDDCATATSRLHPETVRVHSGFLGYVPTRPPEHIEEWRSSN